VFYLTNILAIALALLVARGRPLHQIPAIGLLLIPFLFYPSNYYCHFIFLVPLGFAAKDSIRNKEFGLVVALLMLLCVAQYFTLAEGRSDVRYTYQSMCLLGTFAALLLAFGCRTLLRLRRSADSASVEAPIVPAA
jgi:hypothetical protein